MESQLYYCILLYTFINIFKNIGLWGHFKVQSLNYNIIIIMILPTQFNYKGNIYIITLHYILL